MAEKLTKAQWAEIAVASFFVALIAWLIHMSTRGSYSRPSSPPEMPPIVSGNTPKVDYTPIGVQLPPLPGTSGSGSGCGCNCNCNGGGCSAGSVPPSVQSIVAYGNQASAAIEEAGKSTIEYLASLGNAQQDLLNHGRLQFVVG